jgi:hypothetical protein
VCKFREKEKDKSTRKTNVRMQRSSNVTTGRSTPTDPRMKRFETMTVITRSVNPGFFHLPPTQKNSQERKHHDRYAVNLMHLPDRP